MAHRDGRQQTRGYRTPGPHRRRRRLRPPLEGPREEIPEPTPAPELTPASSRVRPRTHPASQALLIHDAQADTEAAALDLNVGSQSDPPDLPGLAHFCEHMLFLGSGKSAGPASSCGLSAREKGAALPLTLSGSPRSRDRRGAGRHKAGLPPSGVHPLDA